MAEYGKISALEAHRQIIDMISKQLAASSSFNNNSLSYYGLELSYKVEVKLYSRGNTVERAERAGVRIGESREISGILAESEQAALKEDHVTIENGALAGSAKGVRAEAGRVVDSVAGAQAGGEGEPGGPQGGTGGGVAPGPHVGDQPASGGGEAGRGPAGGEQRPVKGGPASQRSGRHQ